MDLRIFDCDKLSLVDSRYLWRIPDGIDSTHHQSILASRYIYRRDIRRSIHKDLDCIGLRVELVQVLMELW